MKLNFYLAIFILAIGFLAGVATESYFRGQNEDEGR